MDIPVIEQAKIQARVLVPLIRALQAELGEERANAIVRGALGDLYRSYGEKWWRARGSGDLGSNMAAAFDRFAAGGALDFEVLRQAPDAYEVNVTGCRYAQFFKQLGAPELGFLLACSPDFPMAEGYGAGVRLKRTQTIMQGASHCDFRYALLPLSIKGVLLVDGKVVLVKNPRNEWELPGGRADPGETHAQVLIREFNEELSIEVAVSTSVDSYVFEVIPGREVNIVTYGCKLVGNFEPRVSDEHSEHCLWPVDRLSEIPLPDGYRRSVEKWANGARA